MLRKIHGTNFFHIKFMDRPNIKCQIGPVLPPAQLFYFNSHALIAINPLVAFYDIHRRKGEDTTRQRRFPTVFFFLPYPTKCW
jgi:hypothetical protein